MKLSTIAAALLLSKEAYAAQEVGRMRKVKIYSSSTDLRKAEFGRDAVDPYIGLADEREQRGLEELSMSTIGSMSTTLEMSIPVTSLTDKSFSLEMSMPATGLTDQSISYPPVQGGAIGSMPPTTALEIFSPETSLTDDQSAPYLPVQGATSDVMATAEIAENSAMTTGHSSFAAVATFVSAIAVVVALV